MFLGMMNECPSLLRSSLTPTTRASTNDELRDGLAGKKSDTRRQTATRTQSKTPVTCTDPKDAAYMIFSHSLNQFARMLTDSTGIVLTMKRGAERQITKDGPDDDDDDDIEV